ncbi:hypothetical protein [Paenibacillus tengchongensis]|uniref:hypothetical protein n=1 Tax=Paenibacillus tengchongensis TaxID=2608684 RepID=UPI00124C5788|nr:hypothetical protein [Paenibacillus tengchongensis]
MPIPISASLIRSLNTLPHHALVIGSSGSILFASDSLQNCSRDYGLPSKLWIGLHYSEFFHAWTTCPEELDGLANVLRPLLQGEHLITTAQLILKRKIHNDRLFRLEAFPLLDGTSGSRQERNYVLSLEDLGPASDVRLPKAAHNVFSYRSTGNTLVPICASCKSIRNRREEWLSMERFLQQELSLQFTHDICPDCIRQLYPRYAGAFAKQDAATR